tara:strand:- start:986 stop:1147 length:162 start_codon:yes stop_codon:yes gene_type:complete
MENQDINLRRIEDLQDKLRIAIIGLINIYESRDPIGIAKNTLEEIGVSFEGRE